MSGELKNKILKLRLSGKSYKQIAKELNCSLSTVSYHCSPEEKNKVKARKDKTAK